MSDNQQKYMFVLQHHQPRYDSMPFSIARTWVDDKGADIAIYLMYDAVEIARKEEVESNPDIKEMIDYLLAKGVQIYTCGFCTRACQLNANSLYPGITVANRHLYYSLMTERRVVNY